MFLTGLNYGDPLPEALGACADLYHQVRDIRLAMDKDVEAVKKRESEIKEHLINNIPKSGNTGVAGLLYRAQIVVKDTVKVADWGVFHSWIRKNDRFDLLQKRVAETAAKDWIAETGKPMPGTEIVKIPDVSITKI